MFIIWLDGFIIITLLCYIAIKILLKSSMHHDAQAGLAAAISVIIYPIILILFTSILLILRV